MFRFYDPTNLQNDYLQIGELKKALAIIKSKHCSASGKLIDTLNLISNYETKRRELIEGGIQISQLEDLFHQSNLIFRDKYGDWVHHDNEYYSEFYELVDELRAP